MKRVISGIQSSGRLHLGNYLGSITNFIKQQDHHDLFIFVADLHAITVDFDPKNIEQSRIDIVTTYLASGLDPQKATIFMQSDINEHAALGYTLMCHTAIGELERMTQYKHKVATSLGRQDNNTVKIPTGLLTYPTLMAADILLYKPNFVPVGADQKQHIELARDLAIRFNKKYGETFVVPEPLIAKVGSRIMDLADPTKKMSKSSQNHKGVIFLDDSLETIETKIKTAKTDSLNKITYDLENQSSVANLITIYSCSINDDLNDDLRKELFNKSSAISTADIEKKYVDANYKVFKEDLAKVVINLIKKLQERKLKFSNPELLGKILLKGKEKAQAIARDTLRQVYDKIGFKQIK